MKLKLYGFIYLFIGLLMPLSVKSELIILVSPLYDDIYYKDMMDDIFDFHIAYAKEVQKRDDVLVLTDDMLYDRYVEELGENSVLNVPMLDIWIRDFSISNVIDPIIFRYTAAAQSGSQEDADEVQKKFIALIEEIGLSFYKANLFNDGGNFVDDYAGNVIISKKFLRDNDLVEDDARKWLKRFISIKNVAFIEADEQGGLEHADGVVTFVDTNTLLINSYPDSIHYARQLKADLRRGLPDVKIYEVITPYDNQQIYDKKFGSACGLYTNALVTPHRIYFPQFGIPEDTIALKQIKAVTSREVIPISSYQVCSMGGGVRCMSWQLRGENAKRLLDYVKTKNISD